MMNKLSGNWFVKLLSLLIFIVIFIVGFGLLALIAGLIIYGAIVVWGYIF